MEAGGGAEHGWRVRANELSEEQPRVPTRGSREFTASVWSSGRCRWFQRVSRAVVHGGSMMASTTVQKGSLHGRWVPLL
jgi:hypothetical protein